MKCLHVNFKLYSRCVATTVLAAAAVAMKAVCFLLCLFKARRPSRFTGLETVLCNRNGLASYDICVYVSGGAPVVHDGQKYTKRQ